MRFVVVVLIWLASSIAHAQIVNVQGALAKVPEGVSGNIELKLEWREGNSPVIDTSGTGTILYRDGKVIGLALVRGGYAKSQDVELSKNTFEHLRTRISIDCRWKWEVFAQHEYDKFRRLQLRALAGTGPAFQIVDNKDVGLLAGIAYVFGYERLDRRMDALDAGDTYFEHRVSAYLTGRETLASNVNLIETIYVQPRIDEPSDARFLGEVSLQTKLSPRIALTNGFTIAYDRSPPDGIERLDTDLKVGVVLKF